MADTYEQNVVEAAAQLPDDLRNIIDYSVMHTAGEESRYSSIMPWQMQSFVKIITEELGKKNYKKFVDITGHIGGEAIVISKTLNVSGDVIEINQKTCDCLLENIKNNIISGQPALNGICDNGLNYVLNTIHKRCSSMNTENHTENQTLKPQSLPDFIYADPPWGGKQYKEQNTVKLQLSGVPISEAIISALSAGVKTFVLKAPNNANEKDLRRVNADIIKREVTVGKHKRPSFALWFFHKI